MIALLGHPLPELMERYQKAREIKWPERLRLLDGELCWNTEEVFCGPFFDEQGMLNFWPISNLCNPING